ncbi:ATP-binding cassette domain-containing protein [Streptomyces sp. CB03234]|uniref:ATP-binding cassette domain-containing protein n=1 Tax=Streptomyces sp. (strain CB03234) TaxID=1703937 RepID=UPI000ABB70B8
MNIHQPLLIATGVQKVYRTGSVAVPALLDLDLTVGSGEMVGVMGPFGSGKTTLLNCLSGLDDIDGGRVVVDGHDLFSMSDAARTELRARTMGFVFQAFNLIPVFSAVENVELPLLLVGTRPREARRRGLDMLDRVGLGHRVDHRPSEMSGGEQQRVTIARALAGRPAIVWADEPTGNLDSAMATQVMDLLCELNHDEGQTIVLVTHDSAIGDRVPRLIRMRDGRLVDDVRRHVTSSGRTPLHPWADHAPQPPGRAAHHPRDGPRGPPAGRRQAAGLPSARLPPARPPQDRGRARDQRIGARNGHHRRRLVVGDTLNFPVRQEAYRTLGPVDERVITPPGPTGRTAVDRLGTLAANPDVDGVLHAEATQAAATSRPGGRPVAEPRVLAWQMHFPEASRFGAAGGDSGLDGANPKPGHVVLNDPLARSLQVGPGNGSRCTCSGHRTRSGWTVWFPRRDWRAWAWAAGSPVTRSCLPAPSPPLPERPGRSRARSPSCPTAAV